MKRIVLALCVLFLTLNTGCIKSLLDKDEREKPAEKYAGVWRLTAGAADVDGDGVLDANEQTTANATSELNLKADFTYTYSLNTLNMSGKWTLSSDNKSISISDNSGAIRFDIQSDNKLHTEPIPTNSGTVWFIYTR